MCLLEMFSSGAGYGENEGDKKTSRIRLMMWLGPLLVAVGGDLLQRIPPNI